MLVESNIEMGDIEFVIGNFLVHYAPNIVVIAWSHTHHSAYKHATTKVLFAFIVTMSYVCTTYTDTYKC